MHRPLAGRVSSIWRLRSGPTVRYSHDLLEKQLNLKQPHELPNHMRRHKLQNRGTPWTVYLAFGALSIAAIGALGYGANRYYTLRPSAKRILDIQTFLPFTLTSKERISATCSIFTLSPAKQQQSMGDPYERLWRSPVWSVEAKQPQLQIARSYTPLPPSKPYDREDPEARALRFIIREEDGGEMSGYLHRLGVGATVDLRGPQLECQLPSDIEDIVFFAGGTGIAPALQLAHYIGTLPPGLGKPPRMQIIWSNRRREDCEGGIDDSLQAQRNRNSWVGLLGIFRSTDKTFSGTIPQSPIVKELERIKAQLQGRLQVDYLVDEENTVVNQAVVQRYLATFKPEQELGRKVVFVSGPEGYVNYLAGPKEWRNGKSQQGSLGGLLKSSVLPHWPVIKL